MSCVGRYASVVDNSHLAITTPDYINVAASNDTITDTRLINHAAAPSISEEHIVAQFCGNKSEY